MVKNPSALAGDLGSIPVLERDPGEGNGNSFQYSCLGNAMDRGTWRTTVYGVTKRVGCDFGTKQQQSFFCFLMLTHFNQVLILEYSVLGLFLYF